MPLKPWQKWALGAGAVGGGALLGWFLRCIIAPCGVGTPTQGFVLAVSPNRAPGGGTVDVTVKGTLPSVRAGDTMVLVDASLGTAYLTFQLQGVGGTTVQWDSPTLPSTFLQVVDQNTGSLSNVVPFNA